MSESTNKLRATHGDTVPLWLTGAAFAAIHIAFSGRYGFLNRTELDKIFASCDVAAQLSNPYGIVNFTIRGRTDVYVCRNILDPWPEFWKRFQYYG